MDAQDLYDILSQREGDERLSWFKNERHRYPPFIFNLITAEDRALLLRWYDETQQHWPYGDGATGFATMSTICGLILGSGVKSLVQCGHYVGFSTLILGMTFRYMGVKNALYTMDVHQKAHEYTLRWVEETGLTDYVRCVFRDSADPTNVEEARSYFGDTIEAIFIDSAHTYTHTKRELELWYPALAQSGFVFLHDVSDVAKSYDTEGKGGVKLALLEFLNDASAQYMLLNSTWPGAGAIYSDHNGLGIIQKS